MRGCCIGIITSLLTVALPLSASPSKTVKVFISGSTEAIESFQQDEVTYISFSELVEALGGLLDWEIVGHQISYIEDTNRFDFVIGSPYFKLNDSIFNLTFPAVYRNGKLFLAAETFVPFLDHSLPQKITWSKESKTLRVDSEYYNVTDLAVSSKANGLLIEVFLTSSLAYDVFVTEGNWLNISIRGGRLNSRRILARRDRRYMYDLKTYQATGSGQLSIRLRKNIEKWHHKLAYDPPRIQISIADVNFELDTLNSSQKIGPDSTLVVVVAAPGRGGGAVGASGPRGTRDSKGVRNISEGLAQLIRKDKQFQVTVTRDGDKSGTLEERANIANQAGADPFISIHGNASVKRYIRGWNVFFLAPARNDSARAVAQFENSFFLHEQSALGAHISQPNEN